MEFTLKRKEEDVIGQLVSWIEDRAKDPVHENNGDVVADFLEKFVAQEIKRIQNDAKEVEYKVDIPDDLIPKRGPDPYKLIHKVVKAMTEEMTDAEGNPISADAILNLDIEAEEEDEEPSTPAKGEPKAAANTVYTGSKGGYNRTGNNHSKGKVKPLTDDQKNYITEKFLEKNGVIDEKDCTEMAVHLGLSVAGKTPWQVTGWVSELHRQVADGRLKLPGTQSVAPTSIPNPLFVPNPRRKRT